MKFAEIRGFRDLIMELYGYPPKVTPRHELRPRRPQSLFILVLTIQFFWVSNFDPYPSVPILVFDLQTFTTSSATETSFSNTSAAPFFPTLSTQPDSDRTCLVG